MGKDEFNIAYGELADPENSTAVDRNALGKLISDQANVFAFRLNYHLNYQDRENIAQSAALKIIGSIESINAADNPYGYIATTVQNAARDLLRKRSGKRYTPSLDAMLEDEKGGDWVVDGRETDPFIELIRHEEQEILDKAVEHLPENEQHIWRLKVRDGLSNSDIASKLGVKETSVKGIFWRARQHLIDLVQKGEDHHIEHERLFTPEEERVLSSAISMVDGQWPTMAARAMLENRFLEDRPMEQPEQAQSIGLNFGTYKRRLSVSLGRLDEQLKSMRAEQPELIESIQNKIASSKGRHTVTR